MLEVEVDRREDLGSLLSSIGMDVTKKELPADYRWTGHGPQGPCFVGLERKKLADFTNSTNYGRLIAQATRMGKELSYCYLLLEAIVRPEPGTGYLMELGRHKRWKVVYNKGLSVRYRTLLGKLMTLTHKGPFRYFHSSNPEQTAQRWFGVGKPRSIIPFAAERTNSPSVSAISAARSLPSVSLRASSTTGERICTANPVSGGDSQFTLTRSIRPVGRCQFRWKAIDF